jgi:cytochrome c-type biogenesis protein
MFTDPISFPTAFVAGLLSFFAPCVLPLIPAYFTFISGFSLEELTENPDAGIRWRVLASTLAYVCGFSLVFILLGASASALGATINIYSDWIRIVGGIVIILFGIHFLGFIKIKSLNRERKIAIKNKPLHLAGTFLVGMAFGAGWSPCIGPLLGSILILAGNQQTVWQGTLLLTVYSFGLALPFILISIFINSLLVILKRLAGVLKYVTRVAGVLMIVIGLMLIFNWGLSIGTSL